LAFLFIVPMGRRGRVGVSEGDEHGNTTTFFAYLTCAGSSIRGLQQERVMLVVYFSLGVLSLKNRSIFSKAGLQS
jgi:hypothetical protein